MIPHLHIEPDSPSPLTGLIRAVQEYYPVGFQIMNEQFEGFQKVKNIVGDKITLLMNNTLPEHVNRLSDQLNDSFAGMHVYNFFLVSFPVTRGLLFCLTQNRSVMSAQ